MKAEQAQPKVIRWGIIGSGNVAQRFMQGLAHVPDAELTAVWSRTPAAVETFVAQHGGMACSSVDALLASAIDAVYIATLPDSHAAYSIAALRAGKHVFCEKPLCLNVAELQEVLAVAKSSGLLFMEAMKPPFFPLYRQLKAHLLADPVGDIAYVRAGSSVADISADHPSFSLVAGGGSMMAIGIYEIFLALDWLGELHQVQAMGKLGETGVDVFAIFQTIHAGGYGQFYNGFGLHGKGDALICGTLGNITLHKNWWNPAAATIDYLDGRVIELSAPIIGGGFNYETAHFCDLLRAGELESPVISHALSLSMLQMLDEVRASIGVRFKGENSIAADLSRN